MKFPDIIIIGGPRCGTTALWYNIDKHPRINMAQPEDEKIEMFFWRMKRWNLGIDWYKSRFSNEISGEKTTGYYANKNIMKIISKNIPDVKLIFCLRNPVDRAFSNYLMNKRGRRVSQTYDYNLLRKRYFNDGKYITHIKNNILPFFDSMQMKICILEYMKKDLTSEMKKVFDFIGVEDLNYKSKKVSVPLVRPGRTRIQDIEISRKEKFYRYWSTSNEKLKGSVRKQSLEYFKPHNEKLFNYLGYKIDEWSN